MSSVAYAPHVAQSPNFKPPPDPFEQIAAQYSKVIDRNHEILEEQGFTPKFMWLLATLMGFYLMSKERVIFASVEKIAERSEVSTRTVKRALAFMRTIKLLNMTPKGIPGKRGGRDDSEYRFNESHSLWKILYVPVKKPVSRETSKCQVGTLNQPHPNIYRETSTPVTVPVTSRIVELRKSEPPKAEAPKAHPVFPEDCLILAEVLADWLGWTVPPRSAAAILGELPPEYGGAPAFLYELPRSAPHWHQWRNIERPIAFLRSKARDFAARWTAQWSNTA